MEIIISCMFHKLQSQWLIWACLLLFGLFVFLSFSTISYIVDRANVNTASVTAFDCFEYVWVWNHKLVQTVLHQDPMNIFKYQKTNTDTYGIMKYSLKIYLHSWGKSDKISLNLMHYQFLKLILNSSTKHHLQSKVDIAFDYQPKIKIASLKSLIGWKIQKKKMNWGQKKWLLASTVHWAHSPFLENEPGNEELLVQKYILGVRVAVTESTCWLISQHACEDILDIISHLFQGLLAPFYTL